MALPEALPCPLPSVNDTLCLNIEDAILEALAAGTDSVYSAHRAYHDYVGIYLSTLAATRVVEHTIARELPTLRTAVPLARLSTSTCRFHIDGQKFIFQ